MENTYKELNMASFKRYYELLRPSGAMRYCNLNDREVAHFPANRTRQPDSPNVEISVDIEHIAFSFNPNRILVGSPGCAITFNRVEKICLFNDLCGDTVYIFCKGSDTVHCIQFDKRYR